MKSRVVTFILVLLACLMFLPLLNWQRSTGWADDVSKETALSTLSRWYNLDVVLSMASRLLYPLGVSIDPENVIIGKEDWLFLGNAHDDVIVRNHEGMTSETVSAARKLDATLAAWQYWYRHQGVVLLGEVLLPNKETVYPDKIPGWATPRRPSATDAMFMAPYADHYFDGRTALLAARDARPDELLYLKTDTHWNAWGAWLSYQSLGAWLKARVPALNWPAVDAIDLSGWEAVPGGDLARFLRLSEELQDVAPVLRDKPLGEKRLNSGKKLLWIRDSFGDAWAPYVHATFPEVSSLHWRDAFDHGAQALLERLSTFQPDFVLYSVVERSLYAEAFTVPPPLLVTEGDRGFVGSQRLIAARVNDLKRLPDSGVFKIDGVDPYWEFDANQVVAGAQINVLALDLKCTPVQNQPINLQVFWADLGGAYDQATRSLAFSVQPGLNLIHLATSPLWVLSGEVGKIRIDIETMGTCESVDIADVRLGTLIY